MNMQPTLALTACTSILTWHAIRSFQAARRTRFALCTESELLADYLQSQDLSIDPGKHNLEYLHDAVIFIVGGGGTIGGQLAQELRFAHYKKLVLIDNDENGLYRVQRKLLDSGHEPATIHIELVDILDQPGIYHIFAKHKPTTVFHYANYKSASMGEHSARAFVRVNLAGTRTILAAASQTASIRTFVYISSDKAEVATTIYGQTKRACELAVQASAESDSENDSSNSTVNYASVRYCNVLDAAGSFAIPTFRNQILESKPVTIRRMPDGALPDRYFIDIHTAAQVAIIAGAYANDADIFSLNPESITPISVADIVLILARAAGVLNTSRWYRRNVEYVPAPSGEKTSELLGQGDEIANSPLIRLHSPRLTNRRDFLNSIEELVHVCDRPEDELPKLLLKQILSKNDRREPQNIPQTAVKTKRNSVNAN